MPIVCSIRRSQISNFKFLAHRKQRIQRNSLKIQPSSLASYSYSFARFSYLTESNLIKQNIP